MVKKARVRIPKKQATQLIYQSANTCSLCRTPRAPVQIHHIDEDPSNNDDANLVVLCQNCHDEAHTHHNLSRNVTAADLHTARQNWEEEVAERAAIAMTARGNLNQAVWTYVNHQRLPSILQSQGISFNEHRLSLLTARGVTDRDGIPIFQKSPPKSKRLTTIYDRFEWDDSTRLHLMYAAAVDQLILATAPLELGAIWTRGQIRELVTPGTLCFCVRGFHFKPQECINGEEDREVYARAQNIEVRCTANTRHMYGNSALYDSFSGSRFAAVLLLAKNIAVEDKNLVIRGTPLAMGAGFAPSAYRTPHPLRYGWARGGGQADMDADVEDIF